MLADRDKAIQQLAARLEALENPTSTDRGADGGDDLLPFTRRPDLTPEDWAGLASWVDMIIDTYKIRALPVCWPDHENLVCELDALHVAWGTATKQHLSRDPGNAMITWHQYSWWPFIARLEQSQQCRGSHVPEPEIRTTDPAYLPKR